MMTMMLGSPTIRVHPIIRKIMVQTTNTEASILIPIFNHSHFP
jgi:hypothetical protein